MGDGLSRTDFTRLLGMALRAHADDDVAATAYSVLCAEQDRRDREVYDLVEQTMPGFDWGTDWGTDWRYSRWESE